jgi:hypothetical protein
MGNVSHRGSDVLGNTYASNSHSDSCDDSVRRGIGHSWPDDFGCLGKSPTPRTCAAQYPRIWQVLPAGIGRRNSAGARRTPPPGQPLAADGAWGRPPRPSSPTIRVVTRGSSTGGMCPHSRTANSARCSPDQFPGVLERARLVVAACRTSTGMSISGRAAGDRGLLAAQHVHHGLRLQGARVVHELREDICGELAAVDRRAKACQKAGGRNAEGENRGHVHPAGGPRHRAAPPRGVGLEMARLSHAIQVLPEADLMAQSAAGTASRSLLVHLRLFPNRHLFPHLSGCPRLHEEGPAGYRGWITRMCRSHVRQFMPARPLHVGDDHGAALAYRSSCPDSCQKEGTSAQVRRVSEPPAGKSDHCLKQLQDVHRRPGMTEFSAASKDQWDRVGTSPSAGGLTLGISPLPFGG